MDTVPENKASLSELLDRVENGEEIVITRDGKPAARLVKESASGRGGPPGMHLLPPFLLKEGRETFTPKTSSERKEKKATAEEIRAIAERFRSLVKGDFSSQDINDILYDEDGLPK